MPDTIDKTQKAEEFFANKNRFTTGPVEIRKRIQNGDDDFVLVDVREENDFRKGHVPGALNLPESRWPTLQGLSKDATNVICCYSQTCHLGSQAAEFFARRGYPVMEMEGGFEAWKENDLEVEK